MVLETKQALAQKVEAAKALLHRRNCRNSLQYWSEHSIKDFTMPGMKQYAPARHHHLLLSKLEQVAAGKIKKLMIFMPPGSAKSTYASVIFPTWFMANNPKSQIIGASSGSALAEDFSRKVKNLMKDHSHELGCKPVTEAADLWQASNGSRYLAAGVGGSITGFRANLAILDDPVKNFEQAMSEKIRESTINWYNTTLHTRLTPAASIVIIQTRWHEEDLSGQLLESQGDSWTVVNLPAIWESDAPDELGRKRNELLWPDWQDQTFIDGQRQTLGERGFYAMFQQTPRPTEGAIFKIHKLKIETTWNRDGGEMIRGWDLAATAQSGTRDPDWTCGVLMQRKPDNSVVILDMVRFREGPEGVRQGILNTAHKDGRHVKISLPQDPGAGGKYVVTDLTKMLMGFNVAASAESGDKATRAMPFAAQVNAGNVSLYKASWNDALIDELQVFPGGRHDDQVDCCSRAFYGLSIFGRPARTLDLPWMYR